MLIHKIRNNTYVTALVTCIIALIFTENLVNKNLTPPPQLAEQEVFFLLIEDEKVDAVSVNLKSFAKTYIGSVFNWDAVSNTASVAYRNRIFSTQASAKEYRNSEIYVYDVDVIEALGIGSRPLVVYHNKRDNNVSIRANFFFRTGLPIMIPNRIFPNADITYSEAFLRGINHHWSGIFEHEDGRVYRVATHTNVCKTYGFTVNIRNELGTSYFFRHTAWRRDAVGHSITIFYGLHRPYSLGSFKWVASHEFGHMLGVGDIHIYRGRYSGAYDKQSIMATFGVNVHAIDIEMALRAWERNAWQAWRLRD